MLKQKLKNLIINGLEKINSSVPENKFKVEPAVDLKFGDYASNIGFFLASDKIQNLLESIKNSDQEKIIFEISILKKYLNFKFKDEFLIDQLININSEFGKSSVGNGKSVLLEFISANPTGPLHIGHGRWAAIGDVLANLLQNIGYKVEKEYYINNLGAQIQRLVKSISAKITNEPAPFDAYEGGYINELADQIKQKEKNNIDDEKIKNYAINELLKEQKDTLIKFGVNFDNWFFESNLEEKNEIEEAVADLKKKELTYEQDGNLWFKSTIFGDDKDRVLIRENGASTYFASDCAYHLDKIKRGFDQLINIWGTDHHGYVNRLLAFFKALENEYKMPQIKIIIGQLVSLFRGKEEVRMSKRSGDFITLKEVIDEIGVDAARYFLVMRSADTHLDFDLELAKKQSEENPVYYVQYAHARICSIFEKAKETVFNSAASIDKNIQKSYDFYKLSDDERDLVLKILSFPDELEESALKYTPHHLTNYAQQLAASFHRFYQHCRVLVDDPQERFLRIKIIEAAKIVLKNTLKILGVLAPEKM